MRINNPFRKNITKLEKRVDELESIVFDLVNKLGYVVTIEATTQSDWLYPELKKVKDDENKD